MAEIISVVVCAPYGRCCVGRCSKLVRVSLHGIPPPLADDSDTVCRRQSSASLRAEPRLASAGSRSRVVVLQPSQIHASIHYSPSRQGIRLPPSGLFQHVLHASLIAHTDPVIAVQTASHPLIAPQLWSFPQNVSCCPTYPDKIISSWPRLIVSTIPSKVLASRSVYQRGQGSHRSVLPVSSPHLYRL